MEKNISNAPLAGHQKTITSILCFVNNLNVPPITKKNVISFLNELIEIDPFHLTEFELSFKVGSKLLERDTIRILNLDAKAYSHLNEKNYLQRLKDYLLIANNKVNNPVLPRLFSAFKSISDSPLDLYIGADIKENTYLLAFWLIFGGAKRNGKINFINNPERIIRRVFGDLNIEPAFAAGKRILNLGFDIDDKSLFYKIYYFLNKDNFSMLNHQERKKIDSLIDFLGDKHKYWFFVSERYKAGSAKPGRKKIYLEFLDDFSIKDKGAETLLQRLFEIIGCGFDINRLKNMLQFIPGGKIVILAFEPDGIITFYIRL